MKPFNPIVSLATAALGLLPLFKAGAAPTWTRAEASDYIIFSSESDRRSIYLAKNFVWVVRDFGAIWPSETKPTGWVVLCGEGSDYATLDPHVQLKEDARTILAPDTQAIVVNLDLQLNSPPTGVGALGGEQFIVHQLQRFYGDAFLERLGPQPPDWLQQGLGRLLRGMVCDEDGIEFPALTSDNSFFLRRKGTEDAMQRAIKEHLFMPLDWMFAMTKPPAHRHVTRRSAQQAPVWLNMEPTGVWEDECYEFAQMCLFSDHGKYRQAFITFARKASQETVGPAAFLECFGMDVAQMQRVLFRYDAVRRDQHYRWEDLAVTRVPPAPLKFFPATSEQIEALRAALGRIRFGAQGGATLRGN